MMHRDELRADMNTKLGYYDWTTQTVDYVLSRERRMLARIKEPLQNMMDSDEINGRQTFGKAIDEALKTISELEGGKV